MQPNHLFKFSIQRSLTGFALQCKSKLKQSSQGLLRSVRQPQLWKYNSQSCRQGSKYCRKPKINELIKSVQQHRNYVTCGVYPIETSFGFGN